MTIPLREAVILYDHDETPPVVVIHWGVEKDQRNYTNSLGAVEMAWGKAPLSALRTKLFLEFHALVVREKFPVDVVHRAFLRIAEYRQSIAVDIPGAFPTQVKRRVQE